MKKNIAVIGECMLELSHTGKLQDNNNLSLQLSYGGDTLNTAIYLARLGITVDYFTALGDDTYSDWLLKQWHSEGVNCDSVIRMPGRLPGVYLIETDSEGERCFHYWRDQTPARDLFNDAATREMLFQRLLGFDVIYLSGITLSLYSDSILDKLFGLLQQFCKRGGRVAFDSNFRPECWPDKQRAKVIFERMYRLIDVALPTLDDELLLYPQESKQQVIQRLLAQGVNELILKQGVEGSLVINERGSIPVLINRNVKAIDTTAAGDSFNAAYLASRLKGSSCAEAAAAGHDLATRVIQHTGAIMPINAMTD